jgi:hypothetical protein
VPTLVDGRSPRGAPLTLEEWQEVRLARAVSVLVPGRLRSHGQVRAAPTWLGRETIATINLGAINAEVTPMDLDSDLPRKEVIQPHLPVRLPCYDFVPITDPTFDGCLLAVGPPASGVADFHDVTGGVYKAREHIHRRMLTGGY